MIDVLIDISKTHIRSIFTAKKYEADILYEDLKKIVFIRHLIKEGFGFIKKNYPDMDAELYMTELKNYALELFLIQCEEAIPEEEKTSEKFNMENHKAKVKEDFLYIYSNLQYHEY